MIWGYGILWLEDLERGERREREREREREGLDVVLQLWPVRELRGSVN